MSAKRKRRTSSAAGRKGAGGEKTRVTVYLSRALWEEARSAAMALGAEGKSPHSLSALFDGALEREVKRLRRLHHRGKSFGRYRAPLPGGRPRKG